MPRCQGIAFNTTLSSNRKDVLISNSSDKDYENVAVFLGGIDRTAGQRTSIGGFKAHIERLRTRETVNLTAEMLEPGVVRPQKSDGTLWVRNTMQATSAEVESVGVCASSFTEGSDQ